MQQISGDVMLKIHNKANKDDQKKKKIQLLLVEYREQQKIVKVRVDVSLFHRLNKLLTGYQQNLFANT